MGEDYTEEINKIVNNTFEKLTLDGRQRVKNEGKELSSSHLKEKADPEPFTKDNLIRKIINLLDLQLLREKKFKIWDKERKVDYRLENEKGDKFLVEAKPINANLYKDSKSGAVQQINGVFKLAEAKEYEFGIATDGIKWVFLNNEGEKVEELDIRKDFHKIRKYLSGEKALISQKEQEEITDKFYQWYDALLHGGKYKDHEGKTRKISKEDCFINNIYHVRGEDKEEIAQVIMNRLIFIKFLQSKGIVKFDVLQYLSELNEDELNSKMGTLFFEVFNQPGDDRVNIPDKFEDIPYLNGNLFKRTQVEKDNPNYQVKYNILVKVVDFLDSFSFVHKESMEGKEAIDPKILGYIFERAMTAAERKSTGAYYTPKSITKYIAENTVYPVLLEKVNKFLKEEKGYKDEELLDEINELYTKVSSSSLWDIRQEILIEDFKVVDPACGSGAFLLAVADILWEIYMNIAEKTSKGFGEEWLKREILRHNIYGVDINPNAVEIARLRLWLWLVDSYNPSKKKDVEPLPNLDTKIKTGNSLVGYEDVTGLEKEMNNLNSFRNKSSLPKLLEKKKELVKKYNEATGKREEKASEDLDDKNQGLRTMLDYQYYSKLNKEVLEIGEEDLQGLNPFHWGSEFVRVFDPEKPEEKRGFDIVVGNPPYIRIQEMRDSTPNLVEILNNSETYQTPYYNYDIAVPFVEKSLHLMSKQGELGFIMTNKWLDGRYGEKLREILSENRYVSQVVNFTDQQVFKGISTYTLLLFLTKKENENIRCAEINDFEDNIQDKLNKVHQDVENQKMKSFDVTYEFITEEPWNFMPRKEEEIILKIRDKGKNLSRCVDRISQGFATSRDDIYIFSKFRNKKQETLEVYSEEEGAWIELEKGILKPLVKGKDIKRFHPWYKGKKVLWPYDEKNKLYTKKEMESKWPKAWKYLKRNERVLRQRENSKMDKEGWYGYTRPQNLDIYNKRKIITPANDFEPSFALDEKNLYYTAGVAGGNAIVSDMNYPYLVSLLNSKLLGYFYVRRVGTSLRGGYYSYEPRFIEKMPIIENNNQRLIELAKKAKNKTKQLHEEINSFHNEIEENWGCDINELSLKSKIKEYWKYSPGKILEVAKENSSIIKVNPSSRDFQEKVEEKYNTSKSKIEDLKDGISSIENEIDGIVFNLYDLTKNEVKTVLDSLNTPKEEKKDILEEFENKSNDKNE